ncbi:hypothetical protein BJ912DRAFT_95830 [Pholiota molesta]|nr:hypothetical protein BJ912DRAFT_95830 [Pholiota molesta]
MVDPMDASFGYTLSSSRTTIAPRRVASPEPLRRRASTLRRGGGDPASRVHSARARAAHARDVPLQIWLPVPPILDLRRVYSALAIARAASRGGRCTPAWMPEKSEEERQAIIATLREVEVKWARRCVCALAIFTLLAVGGALAAWGILRH